MTTAGDALQSGIILGIGGIVFLLVASVLGSSSLINLEFWGIIYVIGGIVIVILAIIAALTAVVGEL